MPVNVAGDRHSGAPESHRAKRKEIIASSEGDKSKASAEDGIKSVQTNAPGAAVVDKTG